MTPVFAIHGAWSTGSGFAYVEKHIPNMRYFEYDCDGESLKKIIARAKEELQRQQEPCIVLGHSLGGLIALALHDEPNCASIITMSSPLAGIRIHPLLDEVVRIRLPILQSIAINSPFINELQDKPYSKPIKNFISTLGYNPLLFDKSDGIVTIRSQSDWFPTPSKQVYITCNHFEILCQPSVVNAIIEFTDCTG